jgi:C-terminal processing protease CtpA/Prc
LDERTALELSAVAREYVDEVLDTLETHSINRYEIDWPMFREATIAQAGAAQTTAETYPAVRDALARLGDQHSFLQPPGGLAAADLTTAIREVAAHRLGGSGYIRVTAYSGDGPGGAEVAGQYQEEIRQLDTDDLCGWIIDVRGNTGGNMWVMLAGVGPLLSDGILGFFVYPDSIVEPWFYWAGKVGYGDDTIVSVAEPYTPSERSPVAVLTNEMTASSGEAIVIALAGTGASRSFGAATRGLATANRGFVLSDGATMFLAVGRMADRFGRAYDGAIAPDEAVVTGADEPLMSDPAVEKASEWLRRVGCLVA